jgi:hypothetical protein
LTLQQALQRVQCDEECRIAAGRARAELMEPDSAKVPEQLMKRLHDATEHFHECKMLLEQAMDSSEYRHQERINTAAERLREAESQVEAIEEQIHQALSTSSARNVDAVFNQSFFC